jgi:predicted molibdopterin-dependent oxidoreductase YjgC
VLAVANDSNDILAAQKLGVAANELQSARQLIAESEGDLVIMFAGGLSAAAQAIVAQLPYSLRGDKGTRRVLLHPLPLYNNSVGAYDMGLMNGRTSATQMLDSAGETIRALYLAGSFLPEQLRGREEALGKLDFLVVQELFETDTTAFADVVLPAASFAEIDGTYTNNDGFVQRVRQSIAPVNQAKADWMITAQLAAELGMNFGFEMSASAVFREIAERVPAYAGLRYPVLRDESNPLQAKYAIADQRDLAPELDTLREEVQALPDDGEKLTETPRVGHELFKLGTLTDKVPQFHLLAAGNPRPETVRVSPLYQIQVNGK